MASPATIDAKAGSTGSLTSVDTWANVRNATTATLSTWCATANNVAQMGRGFCNFDVSSIPTNATVTAVTFVHPIVGNKADDNTTSVHVVAHTGADPIVADDYNNITLNGDTSFGSATLASLSGVSTTNIVLNASGIAACQTAVTAGGIVKYALRNSADINNSQPAGDNQYTTTLTNADIIVTYTVPATSGFLAIL